MAQLHLARAMKPPLEKVAFVHITFGSDISSAAVHHPVFHLAFVVRAVREGDRHGPVRVAAVVGIEIRVPGEAVVAGEVAHDDVPVGEVDPAAALLGIPMK
eukprot:scaffold7881_cov258-Pinguiococcus_pyrenoidosus.AAC.6